MNMLDLVVIILTLLGLATVWHLGNEAKKAALTAAKPTKPWKAWAIRSVGGTLLLLILISHFTGWLPGRREIRDAAANTAAIKELQPLAAKAPALIGMGDKLTTNTAAIAKVQQDLGDIKGLIKNMDARLTNALSVTVAGFTNFDERLQRLEAAARNGSGPSVPPVLNDSRVIQLQPELPAPAVAPAPVPTPAPVQKLDASLQKRLDALTRQVTQAQKTAEEAQRSADSATATAQQANAAAETGTHRINVLESRTERMLDSLLKRLESQGGNAPAPSGYQALPPVPPILVPATPAAIPQGAPAATYGNPTTVISPSFNNDERSFTVTRTLPKQAWKQPVPYWYKNVTIAYEVVGTIKRTDNEANARNVVMAIIERFHNSDGSEFAWKNPQDTTVNNDLVLAFDKAKKKVLKGNPELAHIFIAPRYRLSGAPEGLVAISGSDPSPL